MGACSSKEMFSKILRLMLFAIDLLVLRTTKLSAVQEFPSGKKLRLLFNIDGTYYVDIY